MKTQNLNFSAKLASLILALSLLPNAVLASDACTDLFMSAEMRAHQQKFETFVRPGVIPGRITNTAAKAEMLNRVRRVLPAGDYDVTVNFMKRDKLHVSYSADGNVTIHLSGRESIQSNGRPLVRGFWHAPNVTFGIDGRVQVLPENLLAISTTIVRGDEKSLAGLERADLSIEIDLSTAGTPSLKLTEIRTNWSIYRPEDQSTSKHIRIDPRK